MALHTVPVSRQNRVLSTIKQKHKITSMGVDLMGGHYTTIKNAHNNGQVSQIYKRIAGQVKLEQAIIPTKAELMSIALGLGSFGF
jgi:hypothetical protein